MLPKWQWVCAGSWYRPGCYKIWCWVIHCTQVKSYLRTDTRRFLGAWPGGWIKPDPSSQQSIWARGSREGRDAEFQSVMQYSPSKDCTLNSTYAQCERFYPKQKTVVLMQDMEVTGLSCVNLILDILFTIKYSAYSLRNSDNPWLTCFETFGSKPTTDR